jgi:hypothetical protein
MSTKGMNGGVVVTVSCRGPHSACRAACAQSSCVSATRKGIASCWEAVHHLHLHKRTGLLSSLSSGSSRGHEPPQTRRGLGVALQSPAAGEDQADRQGLGGSSLYDSMNGLIPHRSRMRTQDRG